MLPSDVSVSFVAGILAFFKTSGSISFGWLYVWFNFCCCWQLVLLDLAFYLNLKIIALYRFCCMFLQVDSGGREGGCLPEVPHPSDKQIGEALPGHGHHVGTVAARTGTTTWSVGQEAFKTGCAHSS